MKDKKLSDAIFKIAAAFIVLHADLSFGSVNVLGDWIGFAMILGTLETLVQEEPSAELLRPLGHFLGVWYFGAWVFQILGHTVGNNVFSVIVSVIRLYFQFQLLTNIAAIAEKYAPRHAEGILKLRSMMTVVLTGYTLFTVFSPPQWVTLTVALVYLAAAVLTCKALTELQKELTPPEEAETTFSQRVRENAEKYDRGE